MSGEKVHTETVRLSRSYAHVAADFGGASAEVPSGTFDTITLREPKLDDLVAARVPGGVEIEVERRLVAAISGLTVETVGKLAARDWMRVEAQMLLFTDEPDSVVAAMMPAGSLSH